VGFKAIELALYSRESSEWVEWMKNSLVAGGIDLPSEETCLLFAGKAVRMAEQVRRVCKHQPRSLRSKLIQAGILHQCLMRQLELRAKSRPASFLKLPALDLVDFVQKHGSMEYTFEATDGHRYRVNFGIKQRQAALATQVICLELARQMLVPVRPAGLMFVSRSLATRAGVLRNCACLSHNLFCRCGDMLCCFGVREIEHIEVDGDGNPIAPYGPKAFSQMTGRLVFDILVLNTFWEKPVFVNADRSASPIFADFSHCLMDTDWPRFLVATKREPPIYTHWADKIKRYEQLDCWIKRAEQIDLQQICEIAMKLPAYWYCNQPGLVVAVIEKLAERVRDLRGILHNLVKNGYFSNLRNTTAQAKKLAQLTTRFHERQRDVREFQAGSRSQRCLAG